MSRNYHSLAGPRLSNVRNRMSSSSLEGKSGMKILVGGVDDPTLRRRQSSAPVPVMFLWICRRWIFFSPCQSHQKQSWLDFTCSMFVCWFQQSNEKVDCCFRKAGLLIKMYPIFCFNHGHTLFTINPRNFWHDSGSVHWLATSSKCTAVQSPSRIR